MKTDPRRLRVLLIDDVAYPGFGSLAERTLGTTDLDVIEFPAFRPPATATPTHLAEWEDHLEFWRQHDDAVPWPELLLVDCHFDRDLSAPPVLGQVDPRGLLHGVVQTARLLGIHPRFPFAFVVYSQDLPRVADDPYAVTLFGLLQAMAGQLDAFDANRSVVESLRMEMRTEHYSGTPRNAWQSALAKYRKKLADAFDDGTFNPDPSSWKSAAESLQAFANGATREPPPDDAAVKWTGPWEYDDAVLLCSLFADCRRAGRWERDLIAAEHLEWLNGAVSIEWQKNVINVVYPWMDEYVRVSESRDSGNSWGKISGLPRNLTYQGYGLALTLVWAVEWTRDNRRTINRTPSAIESAMHFVAGESGRAVAKIHHLKHGMTLKPYIERLESARSGEDLPCLNSWVRDAVRDYLRSRFPEGPRPLAFFGSKS